jgi:hypothetical protein
MKTFSQYITEAQEVHKFSDTILKHWERIPFVIRSTMWNRIFTDSVETTAFHITDRKGFENLVKRQGRKNSISTFNRVSTKYMLKTLLYGIETDGQVLLKLKGKQAIEFGFDAFTARTDSGKRTVMLADREWDRVYVDFGPENKKTFNNLKTFLGTRLKMMTILKKPEDMDGSEKQKFIKTYLDSTENYVTKHAEEIRALFTDDLKSTDSYNEVVMEFSKIIKAYVIDDGEFNPEKAIEIAINNKIPYEFISPEKIVQKVSSDSDLRLY